MSSLRVFHSADCNRAALDGKRIGVIGYGSQGRAFALNLKDSKCDVSVHLREGSKSRAQAASEGLPVADLASAADCAVVILALPDHEQPAVYATHLSSVSRPQTIVLLHGSNFHFKNIAFRSSDDVVLVAPHGPGRDLRDNYVNGSGLSCFIAVGQDASGHAQTTALAVADAIGAGTAGIYETTFAAETIGDLFGEQTLLVGGLAGLTDAVVRTMLDRGLSPENAYLETIKQLKLLAAMIEAHGPAGMIARVSKTAGYGSLLAMPSLFDDVFMKRLEAIYYAIESGQLNQLLRDEAAAGFTTYQQLLDIVSHRASQQISDQFQRQDGAHE